MTREPQTVAGQKLDQAWPGTHLDRLEWRRAVLAIETEARALPVEQLEVVIDRLLSAGDKAEAPPDPTDAIDAYRREHQ